MATQKEVPDEGDVMETRKAIQVILLHASADRSTTLVTDALLAAGLIDALNAVADQASVPLLQVNEVLTKRFISYFRQDQIRPGAQTLRPLLDQLTRVDLQDGKAAMQMLRTLYGYLNHQESSQAANSADIATILVRITNGKSD